MGEGVWFWVEKWCGWVVSEVCFGARWVRGVWFWVEKWYVWVVSGGWGWGGWMGVGGVVSEGCFGERWVRGAGGVLGRVVVCGVWLRRCCLLSGG